MGQWVQRQVTVTVAAVEGHSLTLTQLSTAGSKSCSADPLTSPQSRASEQPLEETSGSEEWTQPAS